MCLFVYVYFKSFKNKILFLIPILVFIPITLVKIMLPILFTPISFREKITEKLCMEFFVIFQEKNKKTVELIHSTGQFCQFQEKQQARVFRIISEILSRISEKYSVN